MIGTWILRWIAFGTATYIVSRIIIAIILRKMFITEGKAKEMLENDESIRTTWEFASSGFAQFLITLMSDILLWPFSIFASIYNALRLRDEYLK